MRLLRPAISWNDQKILNHKPFQGVLKDWHVVEYEGNINEACIQQLNDILKNNLDVLAVQSWLCDAFRPQQPKVDREAVKIYLDYYHYLENAKGDDHLQYLNNERQKRGLPALVNGYKQPVQQQMRAPPYLKFRRNKNKEKVSTAADEGSATTGLNRFSLSAPPVERQPTTQNLESAVPFDELGNGCAEVPTDNSAVILGADMAVTIDEDISSKVEPNGETVAFQNSEGIQQKTSGLQDNVSVDGSHRVTFGGKRKRLDDMQVMSHIGDEPVPEGCQVTQIPSDDSCRTSKRRKAAHPSLVMTTENDSLPSNLSSVSNETSFARQEKHDEDGKAIKKSNAIMSAKESNKTQRCIKGKMPVRYSPSEMGPETHPIPNNGAHLVVMGSEGRQQAQVSQLGVVAIQDGQLEAPQSLMAVLASEGAKGGSCCKMEDSEHLDLGSNFPDQLPTKSLLPNHPPIWAESRQEVCEAFDWFRSYQGGVYHADNAVKGYLLSAFASKRDVFENDGRLIISHGGGKSESIGCQQGLSVSYRASDQLADDKSVRALLDNYRTGRPLVLLVDDKYVLFPYDLSSKGVTYAVLGFYSIVYAWAEFQPANNQAGRVIRYKFAFRWCEEQGTPWWCFAKNPSVFSTGLSHKSDKTTVAPRTSPPSTKSKFIVNAGILWEDDFSCESLPPISETQKPCLCFLCNSPSYKVYATWVCLTTNCAMFWRNPETMEFLPDDLEYDKQFFTLRPWLPLPSGMRLVLESTVTRAMNGTSTTYAFTRGIHCPKCGRLSSRYQWEQLECRACKWTKKADIDIRSAKDFWCDRLPVNFEYFQMSAVSDFLVEPIRIFRHEGGKGIIQTFTLPYNRGHIHHIRTPSATGMLKADEIFKHYQEEAKSGTLRFRRWPLKAHKCRGTLLTNYFSHNAGEPYQYVGSDANTVPFEQVPAVMEARELIQSRILQAFGISAEFNELLSCAYMERQKMAFHSDAEVGLGPLVAGLSLGSPALMHFRLNPRHDPLYERRGVLLSIVLRHGDILIMDSNDVQEYYEHTVVPNNFRIAATARQITSKHNRQDA